MGKSETPKTKTIADFEAILDLQREMVCRFLPDTTLTYVNQSYCRMFQKTKDELIGKKFLEFVPEDEHDGIKNHLKILALKGNPISYIHKIQRVYRQPEWQEWTDYIVSKKDGVVTEFQSIGIDVTESQMIKLSVEKMEKHATDLLKTTFKAEDLTHIKNLMDEIQKIKRILKKT